MVGFGRLGVQSMYLVDRVDCQYWICIEWNLGVLWDRNEFNALSLTLLIIINY